MNIVDIKKGILFSIFFIVSIHTLPLNGCVEETLFDTIKKGHFLRAKILLFSMTDINQQDRHGRTPLIYAVMRKQRDMVKLFIDARADLSKSRSDGMFPLAIASFNGDTVLVNDLIEAGASVDQQDKRGWTSLMWAVFKGHEAVARELIVHHASVNIKESILGSTPLHWAVLHNKPSFVESLIKSGASVNIRNSKGESPLDIALLNESMPIAQLLVKAGGQDGKGRVPEFLQLLVDLKGF
ncbi:MAG TPA: ankyrin repeat domain-containing protein [Candidatus Dependentiae bacterium]|nr:ankyrin repeat domain-containing protein [Candidatus Dependentiae bacterium]